MSEVIEHPDIFRSDEAWRYLKLPCPRSFGTLRRQHKVRGKRVGHEYIYSREQLEYLRRCMFGMDLPEKKRGNRGE